MKLVMVDPSKSKSDKIRPTTFHHYQTKTLMSTENNDRVIHKNINSLNTSKFRLKNDIEFRNETGTKIDFKASQHDSRSDSNNVEKGSDLVTLDDASSSVDKELILKNIILGSLGHVASMKSNDDKLVFKMDPKYNPPKKSSHEKTYTQDFSFTKINIIGDGFSMPHTANKVKKLTFVKTIPVSNGTISNVVGNSTPNYEKTIFNNSNFVKQSSKYAFGDENLVIHKSLDKPSMGVTHTSDKTFVRNSDSMDGIILAGPMLYPQNNDCDDNNTSEHKFQMYQMDNHDPNKNKHIIEPKTRLNKAPINPPVLEGYSTYTFKVNMKDK